MNRNRLTTKEITKIAKSLGFEKVKGITSNGQAIYKKGRICISYDVDSHNGGFWKLLKGTPEQLKKGKRDGTFNRDLTKRIGK